jgi:hypothetical protein
LVVIRFQLTYWHAVRDRYSGAGLPKVSYADGGNTAVMHIKTADGVEVVFSKISFDALNNALPKMRMLLSTGRPCPGTMGGHRTENRGKFQIIGFLGVL